MSGTYAISSDPARLDVVAVTAPVVEDDFAGFGIGLLCLRSCRKEHYRHSRESGNPASNFQFTHCHFLRADASARSRNALPK